jgi:hypothetical protein
LFNSEGREGRNEEGGVNEGGVNEEGGKGRRKIEGMHKGVEWGSIIDEGSRVLQGRLGINH